jgi:hypothetical protein
MRKMMLGTFDASPRQKFPTFRLPACIGIGIRVQLIESKYLAGRMVWQMNCFDTCVEECHKQTGDETNELQYAIRQRRSKD